MGLIEYRLGDLLQLLEAKNDNLQYGIDSVRGVNNLKKMMPTKADLNGRDLSKFQIVNPGEFFFNHRTSRNGSKFSITFNDEENPIICTEDYVVFKIKPDCETILSPDWLYMYFNRSEFDRYVITNSWGSSTEFYNWEDICSIELELPPLPVQEKYVEVYGALLANQENYECGLDDLRLAMDVLLEKHKKLKNKKLLWELSEESDSRNVDNNINIVQGVNKDKIFMPSVASGEDLSKYKLVRHNQFACNLMHVGRDVIVPIALNVEDDIKLVSPAYIVFELKDIRIIPEYLLVWLSRNETDRYAWYMCDNSVRSGMEKKRFFEMPIPIPDIEEQRAIADIYHALTERRMINEQLKGRIKNMCPILIKGSIEEARKGA